MVESKQQWKAWLYLSPAIALLLVFTVWPIVNTVRMALLEDYSIAAASGGDRVFSLGIGNFVKGIPAIVNSLPIDIQKGYVCYNKQKRNEKKRKD